MRSAKILALLLCLVLVGSLLTGCSDKTQAPAATEVPATEATTDEPTEEPTEVPTEEPTEEPTEVPTEEPAPEETEEVITIEETEAPTEEATPDATNEPTEEATEVPVEDATEAPVEESTEAPVEDATEAPVEESTEVPVEDAIIAELEDGTQIHLSDALPYVRYYYQSYQSAGSDPQPYLAQMKTQAINALVQTAIKEKKIAEYGCDVLTEEEEAAVVSEATSTWFEILDAMIENFKYALSEDPDKDAIDYLASYGYTQELITESVRFRVQSEKLMEVINAETELSDAYLQAYYQECIAEDKATFEGNTTEYEYARGDSEAIIAWNPSDYRRIYRIQLTFGTDIVNNLLALTKELKNVGTEDAGENPRTAEEIQADIETLLTPFVDQATAIKAEFEGGADVYELIEKHTDDLLQKEEPYSSNGFYVCPSSSTQNAAIIEAAFSLTEVGTMSDPVVGSDAIYLVYYLDDVPAGDVPYEEISEALKPFALEQLKSDYYAAHMEQWITEANLTTYMENFVTEYDATN